VSQAATRNYLASLLSSAATFAIIVIATTEPMVNWWALVES